MTPGPRFGLDPNIIKSLKVLITKNSKVEKIILYGSRAKGNYKDGSDIDLTIKGPLLNTTDLLKLQDDIEDLMLPYKADLSLFHQIENQGLIEHILRVGVEF